MTPTEELQAEHKAILLALRLLDRVGEALEAGRANAPRHLEQLLDFLGGFVDRCHHGKEEDVLLPELEKRGVPRSGGPIRVMLAEHQAGREHVRAMREALGRLEAGDRVASAQIRQSVRAYCALLQAHIQQENGILFRLTDCLLPDEVAASVHDRFEAIERDRVGEGKHEAYHAMLHELEQVYEVNSVAQRASSAGGRAA